MATSTVLLVGNICRILVLPKSNISPVTKQPSPSVAELVLYKKLGRRLQQRRVELGWSQSDLARRSGIDRVHLSLLENGRKHPTLWTLKTLAKPLRLKLTELVHGL